MDICFLVCVWSWYLLGAMLVVMQMCMSGDPSREERHCVQVITAVAGSPHYSSGDRGASRDAGRVAALVGAGLGCSLLNPANRSSTALLRSMHIYSCRWVEFSFAALAAAVFY